MWNKLKALCRGVSFELNPLLSDDAMYKISRCFAMQKTNQIEIFSQSNIYQIMNNVLEQSERYETNSGGAPS